MSVSAIIVSYRTGEVLFACLDALRAEGDVTQVVVVDNGNPPDVRARLEALAAEGRITLTGEGANVGFAAGVNLGASAATCERLLILNPDAVLRAGSAGALEAAREGAVEPVIVGGKIVGEDGREQRGGRRRRLTLASGAATFLRLGWLKALHPGFVDINLDDKPEPAAPIRVGAVSGALMYLSREDFARLGGFDAGYFLHVEDIDICRRAEAAGGAVIYTPFASALHVGGSSDAPAAEVERHKAAGLARYFAKFAAGPGEKLAAALVAPLIGLALRVRAMRR